MRTPVLLALAVACLSTPLASLAAQDAGVEKSRTQKFFLAAAVTGASIKFENSDETESGGGISLGLGYGFTPRFAGLLDFSAANISSDDGDYTLAHFDMGVRFHFANTQRRWVPFVDVAFTGRALGQEEEFCDASGCTTTEVSFSGAGFTFGGGLSFYATPSLALTGGLKITSGEFTDFKVDNNTVAVPAADATSTRLNFGIAWFPRR